VLAVSKCREGKSQPGGAISEGEGGRLCVFSEISRTTVRWKRKGIRLIIISRAMAKRGKRRGEVLQARPRKKKKLGVRDACLNTAPHHVGKESGKEEESRLFPRGNRGRSFERLTP